MFERLSPQDLAVIYHKSPRDKEQVQIETAQAQLKKTLQDVIEWGESECLHHYPLLKRECSKCWQELKDQVERIK